MALVCMSLKVSWAVKCLKHLTVILNLRDTHCEVRCFDTAESRAFFNHEAQEAG